ncbi:MAG: phosphodiesterase [Erythrobacter sp.]|uniref:phosphodiesterase n=1 Tax=Erythrobacter sp. TaxID=1042 RepID=UPI003C72961C
MNNGVLIAQITDTHVGFEPEAEDEEFNFVRFREVLEHLLAQSTRPDMLVLSGDITDGGQRECYERVRRLLATCPFPVAIIPGNHDNREELLRAFPDCPTENGFVQYARQIGELRVLCLDSFDPERHGGAFCDVRAAWLERELNSHRDTPTLIFMHHPPVVAGIDWMDPRPEEPWFRRFHETVAGHRQIVAIEAGHLHRPLHSSVVGIPLSVTPAVAPAVSLDLSPMDAEHADGRAIVATEPPFYSLHLWRGGVLASHFQPVGPWQTLARFDKTLEPMMRGLFGERH